MPQKSSSLIIIWKVFEFFFRGGFGRMSFGEVLKGFVFDRDLFDILKHRKTLQS